jgi:hypothetical protein
MGSNEQTARLIDMVNHYVDNVETAEQIVGQLQSEFMIVELPTAEQEAAARNDARVEMPWLYKADRS